MYRPLEKNFDAPQNCDEHFNLNWNSHFLISLSIRVLYMELFASYINTNGKPGINNLNPHLSILLHNTHPFSFQYPYATQVLITINGSPRCVSLKV